jgi:hypothetical protein
MRASSHRSCRDNDRSPISMRVCARARCRSCDSCSSHHQSMRLRPHHTTSERKLLAFPLNSSDHLSSERDRAPNGNAIWLSVRVRPSRGPAGSAGAVRTRGPRYQPRHCCTQPAGGPTSPTTCGAWGQAPSCIRRRPGPPPPSAPARPRRRVGRVRHRLSSPGTARGAPAGPAGAVRLVNSGDGDHRAAGGPCAVRAKLFASRREGPGPEPDAPKQQLAASAGPRVLGAAAAERACLLHTALHCGCLSCLLIGSSCRAYPWRLTYVTPCPSPVHVSSAVT